MGKVFVGPRVGDLDTSAKPVQITRVTLRVDGETTYTSGDDTGRVLEKDCPWGTQSMCDSILASVRGISYQPFQGTDGLLDPAAEVGDGITIGNVYSTLAQTDITFDGLYTADPAAPGSSEVEDEYPYKSRARRIADRERSGIYSSITKTAEMIRLEVANEVAGLNARITIEVDRITSEVNDTAAGLSSKIEQTATSLTAKITATDGRVSSLSQNLDSIALRVQNAEGDIGQLELTATSFNTRITNAEGDVASLQQTATSLESQITSANEDVSTLKQTATSLSIEIKTVDGKVSSVKQTIDGLTVTDPWGEKTLISGGSIETSTLHLDSLYGDTIYLRDRYGDIGAQFNIGGAASARNACELWTRALRLTSYPGDIYLDARSGYVTLVGGAGVTCGNNFYPQSTGRYSCGMSGFRWSDIYATNGAIQTSDREKKKDIHYGLEGYDALFDRLRPVSYKLVDGQSGRTHLGLISQDVERALEECGISSQDFAGFVRTPREGEEGAYDYSLRYGEFIALCIHQIQLLQASVARLERSVA